LKASIVTYAKLLEKMLAEQSLPQTDVKLSAPEHASPVHNKFTTQEQPKTVEDAKKWVIRAEAGARTATDFFAKISEHFEFRLVLSQHGKIQGYSVLVDEDWVKGTQLGSNLGWTQVCQDHRWRLDDAQMKTINALQYKGGT
jgi:hypothetical protein